MYIYKESFSPDIDKTFVFACVIERNRMNNEIASNVELI